MTSQSSRGQGPASSRKLEGLPPGEDQDQREKKRMRTRSSTPSSTAMAHHCRRAGGKRVRGQRGRREAAPPGGRGLGAEFTGGAAPPSLPHPRGLTTGHVGYFGHLPKDPIHPGLGVAHLLSKGVQHAAETRKASAPRGSVHTGAAGQGLLAHPQGPGLTCPARPAPPQRGRTCVSELRCSQTPFPAVDPAGPGSAAG